MPKLDPGVSVTTPAARIQVDITPDAPLPPGPHRFRLVVTDDSGNQSTPATIEIIVVDDGKPTAVLDLIDANGARSTTMKVPFGRSFTLSGERSSDVGGSLTSYTWTRV